MVADKPFRGPLRGQTLHSWPVTLLRLPPEWLRITGSILTPESSKTQGALLVCVPCVRVCVPSIAFFSEDHFELANVCKLSHFPINFSPRDTTYAEPRQRREDSAGGAGSGPRRLRGAGARAERGVEAHLPRPSCIDTRTL